MLDRRNLAVTRLACLSSRSMDHEASTHDSSRSAHADSFAPRSIARERAAPAATTLGETAASSSRVEILE